MSISTGHQIIIGIYAKVMALYAPPRSRTGYARANTTLGRKTYASAGVPWASSASSTQVRQEESRTLGDLEQQRLLKRVGPATGRTTGVQLTDRGEFLACELVAASGLFMPEAWALFDAIARRPIGCEVPEDDLIPTWRKHTIQADQATWNREQALGDIEWTLTHFMTRDWIGGNSTTRQNVRYWRGPRFDEAKRPDESKRPKLADEMIGAGQPLYYQRFKEEMEVLKHDTPDDQREIGIPAIPVSAGSAAQIEYWRVSEQLAAEGL